MDLDIDEISQTPYTYSYAPNRARLDIRISAEAYFDGGWHTRTGTLRFNVSQSGWNGIFAADINTYFRKWDNDWRVKSGWVYLDVAFEQVYYPDVTGSDTPTPDIIARIKGAINYIKICSKSPEGATIGVLIDSTISTAESF